MHVQRVQQEGRMRKRIPFPDADARFDNGFLSKAILLPLGLSA